MVIPSDSSTYSIPFTNYTVSKFALRSSQFVFGSFAAIGAGFMVAGNYQEDFKEWSYPLGLSLFSFSIVGLISSCVFKSKHPSLVDRRLANHAPPPPILDETTPLKMSELIHELCEMKSDGSPLPCSMSRMHEIIVQLQETNTISAINTIPQYYLDQDNQLQLVPMPSPIYTPLQYWASKGNLEAIQLLVANGACDYNRVYESSDSLDTPRRMTSAMYIAALYGQSTIVDYLLQHGATGTIAFKNNILRFFIPKFVFEICQLDRPPEVFEASIHCLEKILTYLKAYHPENLQLQLKIPIAESKNSILWVKEAADKLDSSAYLHTLMNHLRKLLIHFGGKDGDVFSIDELESKGNIGIGMTLYEASTLK